MSLPDYESLFYQHYPEAKKSSGSEYIIHCHSHPDKNPSLSVNLNKGCFRCLSCKASGHISELPNIKAVAHPHPARPKPAGKRKDYVYTDPTGAPVFRVVKLKDGEKKKSWVERWDGKRWIRGKGCLDGLEQKPLYNLPEVLRSQQILLVEGEKDVESLRDLGLVATTNAFGARSWQPYYNAYLAGKDILILADNDTPGKERLYELGFVLRNVAQSVKHVILPDLKEKEDVTDFLEKTPQNVEHLFTCLEKAEDFPWERSEEWVEKMNETYACVWWGGKFVVLMDDKDPYTGLARTSFLAREDFKAFEHPLGKKWLEHPQRRQYKGITFAPLQEVSGYYNLWKGFAMEPKENPSLTKRFWHHVYQNIAKEDQNLYDWIRAWCAQMIQKPWEPAGTAIILSGTQGTGKSIFAETLGELLKPHFFISSSTKQFAGNFNQHLLDVVLVFGDETWWAGDRTALGTIKRMITQKTISVEAKFKDCITLPNRLHLIMASNEPWVVNADLSERRMQCFEMADTCAMDRSYFQPLVDDLEAGGYAALLYELLHLDYEALGIDPQQIIETDALISQKEHSAGTEIQFLLDTIEEGEYFPGWEDENCIPFAPFYEAYEKWMRQSPKKQRATKKSFGKLLRDLFGEPVRERITYRDRAFRTPCYKVASFEEFQSRVNSELRNK